MSLLVSVSQIKTFRQCPRLWWFQRVRKFPGAQPIYGMTFGSILHGVLERWLGAEPNGRDKTGQVVDLYPFGWDWHDGYTLEPGDDELIKNMLATAIKDGILVRTPGLEVEKFFLRVVLTKPLVIMQGYIDVALPYEVQDHKGVKIPKYALDPSNLKDDLQMLTYGKVQLGDQPHPGRMPVTLRHNQFFRKTGKVKTEHVTVTPEDLDRNWHGVEDSCRSMVELASKSLVDTQWDQVECGPKESCRKYAGCKFASICYEGESPSDFRARRIRLANPKIVGEKANTMNLDDKLKARKAYKTKAPAKPKKKENSATFDASGKRTDTEEAFTDDDNVLEEIKTKKRATKKAPSKRKSRAKKKAEPPAEESIACEPQDCKEDDCTTCPEKEPAKETKCNGFLFPDAYVDCYPTALPFVVPFHDVFKRAIEDYCEVPLHEYYALDCWKRRDKLAEVAEKVAESYDGQAFFVNGLNPDEFALFGHMQPWIGLQVHAVK